MKRLLNHKDQLPELDSLIIGEIERRGKIVVTIKASPKSHEQLGYLHASVLPILTLALYDAGEIKTKSEGAAKFWLKVMIGYGEYYELNTAVVFDPKSFADADIDILIKAIDTGIFESEQRGFHIPPPKLTNQRKL